MIQLVEIKISFLRKHFDQIAISKSMIYVMVKIFTISRSNNDGPLSVDCIFLYCCHWCWYCCCCQYSRAYCKAQLLLLSLNFWFKHDLINRLYSHTHFGTEHNSSSHCCRWMCVCECVCVRHFCLAKAKEQ